MYVTASEFSRKMPDASYILSDEPEMESSQHYLQLLILVTMLNWLWRDRTDYFIGANLTIYYSREQLLNRDFRGPDFFLVKNVTNDLRPSWVVWEEGGQYPNLIIELLSDSTANVDRTIKKQLYQNRFRTPEYFWFSPDTLEFEGYRLSGHQNQAIATNEQGWRWSEELELYLGVEQGQLRYFSADGEKIPTPEEFARREIVLAQNARQELESIHQELESTHQELESARQEADIERQRAEQLAQRLRELGVNLD